MVSKHEETSSSEFVRKLWVMDFTVDGRIPSKFSLLESWHWVLDEKDGLKLLKLFETLEMKWVLTSSFENLSSKERNELESVEFLSFKDFMENKNSIIIEIWIICKKPKISKHI